MVNHSTADRSDASNSGAASPYTDKVLFYSTIGHGLTNWTRMETRIIHFSADLLDTNIQKAGVVFYSINNFYSWLSIIEDLLSLDKHLSSVRREWTPIAARLRKLNDTRVRLAHHGASQIDSRLPDIHLKPAREDFRSKSRAACSITVDAIMKFTEDTIQIAHEIEDLQKRLRASRMRL